MHKKHKLGLTAAAVLLAVIPATRAIQDHLEATDRESLERAAQQILQHNADRSTAAWRKEAAPAGRVWAEAVAEVQLTDVRMDGDRATVELNQSTTPYATTAAGSDREPTIPFVSSHVFVFERAGDGWRLAEDLTQAELRR